MAKTPKVSKRVIKADKKFRRNLLAISLVALGLKLLIIFNIEGFDWYEAGNEDLGKGLGELLDNNYAPPNAWYLADGDNYVRALQGLHSEGFLSNEEKLTYWPAGYPLLMWPLLTIFRGYFFLSLAVTQSILYAIASIWFVDELRKTRVKRVSYLVAIFLAFNPTLSLNTISVGYELPVVSMSLLSAASLIRYFMKRQNKIFSPEVFVASFAFAFAVFMQPRLILIAFAFFCVWAIARFKTVAIPVFLVLVMGIVSIAPSVLMVRNYQVHGHAVISTNLGNTMRLGAGPGASGGYSPQPVGLVECPVSGGDAAKADRALVDCVVDWYFDNPSRALVLFWNKARFFWSPWFGPEYNGTMARNPWLQNHPLRSTAQTPEGFKLIFGNVGKLISWLWMLAGLFLLIYGFMYLWRLGDLERLLGLTAGLSFVVNLVSTILTIGDNRFRIPSMAMSILLQCVGILGVISKRKSKATISSSYVPWPIFAERNNIGK